MKKSRRISHGDLRSLYLTIGECKELGADPVAWRVRLLESLLRLLEAAHGATFGLACAEGPDSHGDLDLAAPTLFVDAGIADDVVRRSYRAIAAPGVAFVRDNATVLAVPEAGFTIGPLTRRQMLDDRSWYSSDFVCEQLRLTGLDDFVGSMTITNSGSTFSLGAHRLVGDAPFAGRERRLLRLCLEDVLPLLGTRLATGAAPSIHALAPRLRQTLWCLFEGDSEKQIAARLGISRHTVHEYVRRLHRLFEVRSRSELLARCAPYLLILDPASLGFPAVASGGEHMPGGKSNPAEPAGSATTPTRSGSTAG